MCFYRWLTDKSLLNLTIYLLFGIFAIYFHLLAAVAIFTPLLFVSVCSITGVTIKGRPLPRIRTLCFIALLVVVGILLWFLPASASLDTMMNQYDVGFVTVHSLFNSLSILCGTASPVVIIFISGLFVIGLIQLYRQDRFLAGFMFSLIFMQFLAIILSERMHVQVPLAFARYFMLVLPICMLITAVGIDLICEFLEDTKPQLKIVSITLIPAFAIFLFLAGPVPHTYSKVNSFTNHSAYQEKYKPVSESEIFISDYFSQYLSYDTHIPEFYKQLAKEEGAVKIIEYPMMSADHFNLYYFYQMVHGKQVILGWNPGLNSLNDALRDRKLDFKRLIHIKYADQIEASGAKYIVVHKNLEHVIKFFKSDDILLPHRSMYEHYMELVGSGRLVSKPPPEYYEGVSLYAHFKYELDEAELPMITGWIRSEYGDPVYEDSRISVYLINNI